MVFSQFFLPFLFHSLPLPYFSFTPLLLHSTPPHSTPLPPHSTTLLFNPPHSSSTPTPLLFLAFRLSSFILPFLHPAALLLHSATSTQPHSSTPTSPHSCTSLLLHPTLSPRLHPPPPLSYLSRLERRLGCLGPTLASTGSIFRPTKTTNN